MINNKAKLELTNILGIKLIPFLCLQLKRENREGKLLTVVDCYMKQHGISKQETLSKFIELVEDGWKKVNMEWAMRTSIPKDMAEQLVNYARIAEVTYKNCEDGYTNPEKFLAPYMVALFVDPIAI